MKFIIRAKTAEASPIHVEGTWTVEAADREEALSLMEQHISLLPTEATLTIRPWTPDDNNASDGRSPTAVHQVAKPTAAA